MKTEITAANLPKFSGPTQVNATLIDNTGAASSCQFWCYSEEERADVVTAVNAMIGGSVRMQVAMRRKNPGVLRIYLSCTLTGDVVDIDLSK